ncbi:Alpha/beta hydrolase fold-3 [Artemisia annua]|uniref:protein-S-isoprenylcysteine alpha-carbonyl methylesterase n=1 Tax=Artemisia annua TaxID=35608 RepID=A0A2U1LK45_ARTAN|nr:Alpha/beta hydrolase fold-3 [Artemisia annua]
MVTRQITQPTIRSHNLKDPKGGEKNYCYKKAAQGNQTLNTPDAWTSSSWKKPAKSPHVMPPGQIIAWKIIMTRNKSPSLYFPETVKYTNGMGELDSGGWESDESLKEAALRESVEEAGVFGTVEKILGKWHFKSKTHDSSYEGFMFPLLVKEQLECWPEKDIRQSVWVSVPKANEGSIGFFLVNKFEATTKRASVDANVDANVCFVCLWNAISVETTIEWLADRPQRPSSCSGGDRRQPTRTFGNYPKATIAEMVQDASRGILFVCNNNSEYGGDPNRIYLMGQSVGAHIAACALVDQAIKESDPTQSTTWSVTQIKSYFGLSGGYNLFNLANHLNTRGPYKSLFYRIMGGEESLNKFSPEIIVQDPNNKNTVSILPPVVLFHGTADYSIPADCSKTFVDALQRVGAKADLMLYEGKTHTDVSVQDPMRGDDKLFDDLVTIIHAGDEEALAKQSRAPSRRRLVPEFMLKLASKISPF